MGGVLRLRQSAAIVAVASSLVIFAFLLSYSLSASDLTPNGERVVYPYVFLSVAIDYPPGECVGNVVLNLAALGLSVSFVIRYLEVQLRLVHQTGISDGPPHWLNLVAVWVAEVTVVGGTLGVTAIPWHVDPGPHMFFAFTLFYGGGAYIAAQCLLDHAIGDVPGVDLWVRGVRIGCVVLGSALMLVYWLCFGPAGQDTSGMYEQGVESRGQNLMIFFAAAAEIAALTLLMLHIGTYAVTQNALELVVSLQDTSEAGRADLALASGAAYGGGAAELGAGGAYKTFAPRKAGSAGAPGAGTAAGSGEWREGGSASQDVIHVKLPSIKTGREQPARAQSYHS